MVIQGERISFVRAVSFDCQLYTHVSIYAICPLSAVLALLERRSTCTCILTPSFSSCSFGPTPDIIRIWGLPIAPAERMTSFLANTVTWVSSGVAYSTPVARCPLKRIWKINIPLVSWVILLFLMGHDHDPAIIKFITSPCMITVITFCNHRCNKIAEMGHLLENRLMFSSNWFHAKTIGQVQIFPSTKSYSCIALYLIGAQFR
jgi:energy-converting hydrogenase Eha subunit E